MATSVWLFKPRSHGRKREATRGGALARRRLAMPAAGRARCVLHAASLMTAVPRCVGARAPLDPPLALLAADHGSSKRRLGARLRRRARPRGGALARRRLAIPAAARARCAIHVCTTRHARTSLRASPHSRVLAKYHDSHKCPDAPRYSGPLSPPPPRTPLRLARRPQRTARSTPRAPYIVRRPLRHRPHPNIARRLLITRAHTQPERPASRGAASSPARRRLALASSLRADRTARCAAHHARTLCAPRLARSTLSAIRSPPKRTRNHNAPARRDAAGPSARRRLDIASGSRADRTAPCATHFARNTLRATLRTQHAARRPLNTHTHARPRTPRRAAALRSFQPAAASHSLPDHTPTAPHHAQHTAHAAHCAPRFARSTLRATRSPHTRTQTTNAPTRRDAADPSGAIEQAPPPPQSARASRARGGRKTAMMRATHDDDMCVRARYAQRARRA